MEVSDIRVGGWARREVGGLGPLIDSIEAVGLLNPIVAALGGALIAGYRRLKAFKKMGMEGMEAIIEVAKSGIIGPRLGVRESYIAAFLGVLPAGCSRCSSQ